MGNHLTHQQRPTDEELLDHFLALRCNALWRHSETGQSAIVGALRNLGVEEIRTTTADQKIMLSVVLFDLDRRFPSAAEHALRGLALWLGQTLAAARLSEGAANRELGRWLYGAHQQSAQEVYAQARSNGARRSVPTTSTAAAERRP
jgi:hypothetical protein